MSITSTSTVRVGNVTVVTVVSDLVGTVYYHWYLDGAYMGQTTAPSFSFSLSAGEQARIDVVDTLDAAFDPLAAPPAFHPARWTLHWIRETASADVAEYMIEHWVESGDPIEIARIPHDPKVWDYRLLSERLQDLVVHNFRVRPVDTAGNVYTPVSTPFNLVQKAVRVPDAPRWSFTYNPATDRVTFAAAA